MSRLNALLDRIESLLSRIPTLVPRIFIVGMFANAFWKKVEGGFDKLVESIGRQLPMPELLAVLTYIGLPLGCLMILLGVRTRIGAAMLFLWLVPTTVFFHAFWSESDPAKFSAQFGNFLRNVAFLGGFAMLMKHGGGSLCLLPEKKPEKRRDTWTEPA